MTGKILLTLDEATALCAAAARNAGANAETARSIAAAAVRAEAEGEPAVGMAHFLDYLRALQAGRMKGDAEPRLTRPAPAMILSDAGGGAAHTGYDRAFEELVAIAEQFGLALFSQSNAYTCGALGYFTARLAERGLVGLAATNGPALLAGSGSKKRVFCTNPLSFAVPQAGGPPLVIDQSSSATAYVNVRSAAAEGRALPQGWALDAGGRPTTDAAAAVTGALLPFGGARGANIALMVEILAAGVSGATWSLDAPSFTSGDESPGSGLFVLAIRPQFVDPRFADRMRAQMKRLSEGYGVHIPGLRKAAAAARAVREGVEVPAELVATLRSFV